MRTPLKNKLELIKQILDTISQGTSAKQAIKQHGIAENTFYRWLREDKSICDQYIVARTKQANSYMAIITEQLKETSKLKAWQTMWEFGRLKAKRYKH